MGTFAERTARKEMHRIIDLVDEEKVKAMLTLFRNIIEENNFDIYTNALKKQIDNDFLAYKNGEKTFSEKEVKARTNQLLKSLKTEG